MKKSIRTSFRLFFVIMVVIVYITTIILINGFDFSNIVNLTNIVFLVIFIVAAIVVSTILSNMIVYPLKKIEKQMAIVADGKFIDTKHLKDYTTFKELEDLINSYTAMMNVIKKNNFDLTSQQSKTEIILEHMADGVIAFSIDRQVIHMNKSAMRLLSIDKKFDSFEKIINNLKISLDFDKIMYMPNYKTIAVEAVVKNTALNIVFVPFFSEKLKPMGVIMLIRNITERVRLDNMRKEFVANVSHELKTPLTSIKGYSETMMAGDLTYQEIMRFSKVINQEANRMDRLVADLLKLSRFDYQKVTWNKTMFSLVDLTKNVVEKMQYLAQEKNHKLEFVVTVEPPRVYADKAAIEQVIMNIISNSIKYTKDGGEITVYVGSINSNVYIKVKDNGIGIPKQDLNRIFERFYRVDKARSRKMGGTGLGLSIVKEMVDGNDGTIEILSEVDKGTEVIITLPTKIKSEEN